MRGGCGGQESRSGCQAATPPYSLRVGGAAEGWKGACHQVSFRPPPQPALTSCPCRSLCLATPCLAPQLSVYEVTLEQLRHTVEEADMQKQASPSACVGVGVAEAHTQELSLRHLA